MFVRQIKQSHSNHALNIQFDTKTLELSFCLIDTVWLLDTLEYMHSSFKALIQFQLLVQWLGKKFCCFHVPDHNILVQRFSIVRNI